MLPDLSHSSKEVSNVRSIHLFLKLFFRSRQFVSTLLAISILASVFVTTSSIGYQVYGRFGNELSYVLGTQSGVETLNYALYTNDSGNQCIAEVNSSSFAILSDNRTGIVAGEYSGVSGIPLLELPSMLNYCILVPMGNITESGYAYLGGGSVALKQGDSEGFVKNATYSLYSIIGEFWQFGFLAVLALSVTAWSFALRRSQNALKSVEEQGLKKETILLSLIVLSSVIFVLTFFFSITFSVFVQNISIGAVDSILGSSLLYSGVGLNGLTQAAILSSISALSFALLSLLLLKRGEIKQGGSRKKGLAYLVLLLFFVAFASSLPYITVVSSTTSIDYLSITRGRILIPATTQFPLTTFFALPQGMNCSIYSAELAYPASINGYRTVVRGVSIANSSYFYDWHIVSGVWPDRPYQIALGEQIAAELGVSEGDKVRVTDQLTGNYATFTVTGIYKSHASTVNEQEGVTSIQSANAMSDSDEGDYSYVRVQSSCMKTLTDVKEAPALGVSQLLTRILLLQAPQVKAGFFSVFSGIQPLVNSMAALSLAIVAGSSVSTWYASEVFVSSSGIRQIARIRWEQGEKKLKLYAGSIGIPALLASFSIIAAEIASAQLLRIGNTGSFFYQKLIPPNLFYLVMLFLVLECSASLSLYMSNRRFEE